MIRLLLLTTLNKGLVKRWKKWKITDLFEYSNIPGNCRSWSINALMFIESGLRKYPISGQSFVENFFPLHVTANFSGKRWWAKRISINFFTLWPGSRDAISSVENTGGTLSVRSRLHEKQGKHVSVYTVRWDKKISYYKSLAGWSVKFHIRYRRPMSKRTQKAPFIFS